ncbi:methyltransferase-like protein 22 isoform X2 [Paramacrobiotus metropolitanus]|uniref:methyltransferase-like protein 22 isoform X2 n=1 Tax=Paramacrobiotus metropolitanus TaxID=2943436 RepID=UPI0024459142|nr:methyltransferase-like protein 22 isoform X2 [Paramacrobiotus metropolitanus]
MSSSFSEEAGYSALEPDETVLSDVHVLADETKKTFDGAVISRFVFTKPVASFEHGSPPAVDVSTPDDDEDLDVERHRGTANYEVIRMEHRMAAILNHVGAQIWKGALFLSDFLIAHPEYIRDSVVLELGAGVGFASVVSAYIGSRTVFCTDALLDALQLCQRNIARNSALFPTSDHVRIRRLDWLKPFEFKVDKDDDFGWHDEDLKLLRGGFAVIAADVIYSDELTDAFFATILNLCTKFNQPFDVWLSIEKRLNFTLDDLAVCSPPYRHFQDCLRKHATSSIPQIPFITAKQIGESFIQAFDYERTPELVGAVETSC